MFKLKKILATTLSILFIWHTTIVPAMAQNPGWKRPSITAGGGSADEIDLSQFQGGTKDMRLNSGFQPYAATGTAGAFGVPKKTFAVHIYGAVQSPGSYDVEPADRLTKLVEMAQGLLENGSERRIELRRAGQPARSYDLFTLRNRGDITQNPFLQTNDVVYVPYQDRVVLIQGPVNATGTFELKDEVNVYDLIHTMANGYTVGVTTALPIKVIRYDENNKKQVIEVANTDAAQKAFKLQAGDVVQVPHKFNIGKDFDYSTTDLPGDHISFPGYMDRVFTTGGVQSPKAIRYDPRLQASNYISIAGGQSRLAKDRIEIIRLDGTKIKASINDAPQINPGDTIIVDQQKIAPEFWISFMATLASIGLSAYAILHNN